MGSPRARVSSRTIRYSSGACCSVTGLDRLAAMAMRSENQYIARLNANATNSMISAPLRPAKIAPRPTNRPPMAAMRIQVFTRLIPVISSSFSTKKDLRHTSGEGLAGGFLPPGPAPSRVRLDGRPAWATPLRCLRFSHEFVRPTGALGSPPHEGRARRDPGAHVRVQEHREHRERGQHRE